MAKNKSKLTYGPHPGGYIEPENYFPKEIRRKFGLGEYAKKQPSQEKPSEKGEN